MSSCSRCCHVFYCCAACQNAAWKEHKPFCDYVAGVTAKKGRRPTSGTCDPLVFLRGVMRVRSPLSLTAWHIDELACAARMQAPILCPRAE